MTKITITAEVEAPDAAYGSVLVRLSNPARTYGIRELGSQRTALPPDHALYQYDAEHYKYEINDPQPGSGYEYFLNITDQLEALYIPSVICPLASEAFVGYEDSSVSVIDQEPTTRSIKLRREETASSWGFGSGDAVRVRITAYDAVAMPNHIFGFINRLFDVDTGAEQEDFQFVISPYDAAIYPEDVADPTQSPPFYRKDVVDVVVPTPMAAQKLWDHVRTEVNNLIAAYERLDWLSLPDSQSIN